MPKLARLQLSFALTCLYLLVFIPACGNPSTTSDSASPRLSNAAVSPPIATPTSATSTVCPASGSGRPAVMPALQLGTHQQIVYYHNIDNQMVLDIFDTQRKGSSALCVLSLQPVFVENDGGKCFLPQHIICEVLLLTYASVHIRWF